MLSMRLMRHATVCVGVCVCVCVYVWSCIAWRRKCDGWIWWVCHDNMTSAACTLDCPRRHADTAVKLSSSWTHHERFPVSACSQNRQEFSFRKIEYLPSTTPNEMFLFFGVTLEYSQGLSPLIQCLYNPWQPLDFLCINGIYDYGPEFLLLRN